MFPQFCVRLKEGVKGMRKLPTFSQKWDKKNLTLPVFFKVPLPFFQLSTLTYSEEKKLIQILQDFMKRIGQVSPAATSLVISLATSLVVSEVKMICT